MRGLYFGHKTTLFSYLALGGLLFLVGVLLNTFAGASLLIEYMKYSIVLLFLVNVSISLFIQKLPIYHPFVMFMGMFFLFILNRVFLDVIGLTDFAQTNMFSHYVFEIKEQKIMLLNIAIAIWSLQAGSMLGSVYSTPKQVHADTDLTWTRIGLLFFYLGMPFLFYQFWMAGMEVVERGYSVKLTDSLEYQNTFFTTLMSRLSLAGFICYLAGFPKSRHFYLHLSFFVITFSLQLLQGMRGVVMCMLLVLFYYVFSNRDVILNKYYLIGFIVFLFLSAAFIGSFRSHEKLSEKDNWAFDFLYNQGVTIQVLGYAVEYQDEVEYKFKDMFSHVMYRMEVTKHRFFKTGVTEGKVHIMNEFGNLSYQLTYKVNRSALLGGWDMASSYLAELYLLGKAWMMLIVNVIIGFFSVFAVNILERKKTGMLILLMVLPSWLIIPRDNLFDFITDNITNVVFVLMILTIVRVLKKRNILLVTV